MQQITRAERKKTSLSPFFVFFVCGSLVQLVS